MSSNCSINYLITNYPKIRPNCINSNKNFLKVSKVLSFIHISNKGPKRKRTTSRTDYLYCVFSSMLFLSKWKLFDTEINIIRFFLKFHYFASSNRQLGWYGEVQANVQAI
jgi:hypothetical protein